MQKIISLLLLGFGGWWLLKKYKAVDNLSWRLSGASINKKPLGIKLNFVVDNPTSSTLTISGIFGDVFLNNIYGGKLISYEKQTINKQSSSNFSYTIRPSLGGAINIIKDFVKGERKVEVRFDGNIISNGVTFPFVSSLSI